SRAIGKIEKQALKLKKKIIDRKHNSKKFSAAAPNPDGHIKAAPAPVRIINARRYSVKPMTAEEAALDLSGKSDNFIVFRDADTSRVGVLYKRQDGNFGLIEPSSILVLINSSQEQYPEMLLLFCFDGLTNHANRPKNAERYSRHHDYHRAQRLGDDVRD